MASGRRLWDRFGQATRTGAVACTFVFLFAIVAFAQTDKRQNAPGEFDFYVLSLSWSPSFCEAARERGNTGRSQQVQCGGRPFSFVVHGLWPQYERGFPDYCERPSPRLARNIMTSMLDLMPAPGLIFNEGDKHGTCSGLGARAYFESIRKGVLDSRDIIFFLSVIGFSLFTTSVILRSHRAG